MRDWKKTFQDAIWISFVALVLASSAYALRPQVLPLFPVDEGTAVSDPKEGGIAYIELEAAIRHFEQGTAIFADARSLPAFEVGHVRGAWHLEPQEFDIWSARVFSEIPADQMVISYCDGAQCSLSLELADKFIWLGYENVVVLKDGWGLWQSKNMPVGTIANK